MLNRRVLRIKAMQALYGYFLMKQSLVDVAIAELLEKYALDPAVHDFNDSIIFKDRQEKIRQVFQSSYSSRSVKNSLDLDPDVIDEINTSIKDYYNSLDGERRAIGRKMVSEVEGIYRTYIKLLLLPGELAHLEGFSKEKEEKNLSKQKADWHFNLARNPVIHDLTTLPSLVRFAIDNNIKWNNETDTLRKWYREIISPGEDFVLYQKDPEPTVDDHLSVVISIFRKFIFKSEIIEGYFTENDLHWSENKSILKNLIMKTLKEYSPGTDHPFELKSLSLNLEDDLEFFRKIFEETIAGNDHLESIIEKKAMNWDLGRIASLDIILLKMALTEMMVFPSIPVKVTINEFIEISKLYSTPKSKQFINGILDVLANQLTSDGVIKKSGRGLIDNK